MPRHAETRVLPWTPEQLFALVADVARYPEFLPWVVAARVRSDDGREMLADLSVGFKALRETFTSRVTKDSPHSLHVDYVSGPLKRLTNDWRFAPEGAGCRIDFAVDFEFRSRLFERVAGAFFGEAFRQMVAAFEARARQLYGSNSSSATSAA